jgi:hypothetical protein
MTAEYQGGARVRVARHAPFVFETAPLPASRGLR